MGRGGLSGLVALVLALGTVGSGSARAAEQLVADARSGCKVVDLHIVPQRSVTWSGACANGLAEGVGTVEWFSEGRLEATQAGAFVAGRAEGRGEMRWMTNGRRYEGDWVGGHRVGQGVLTFSNGERFIGAFVNDRPSGDGEFVTAAGQRLTAHVAEDGSIRAGAVIGHATPTSPNPVTPPPLAPRPVQPALASTAAPPPPPPPSVAASAPPIPLTPARVAAPTPLAPLAHSPPVLVAAPARDGNDPVVCRAPNGAVVSIKADACRAIGGSATN